MADQQVQHHRRDLARLNLFNPAVDHRVSTQLGEGLEPLAEVGGVLHEEIVVFEQKRHPLLVGQAQVDAGTAAHRFDEGVGHTQVADFLAFALHKHGAGRVEALQGIPDQAVEGFLAGLWHPGYVPQHRAAVAGDRFEVQHLGTLAGQGLQQAGLAATRGAADHAEIQALRQSGHVVHQGRTPGFVASFDERDLKADGSQNGRQ